MTLQSTDDRYFYVVKLQKSRHLQSAGKRSKRDVLLCLVWIATDAEMGAVAL